MYVQPEDWPYFREYYADFVICIDATASMAPILNEVKANVLKCLKGFLERMKEFDKKVGQLRIKMIAFRDYAYDGEPMVESAFLKQPEQWDTFVSYLDAIEAKGGGGGAENALEALALALKSDWTTGGERRRHIVLLFTDAPALPLGARADSPGYPGGLPKDLAQLTVWWERTDPSFEGTFQRKAGRLVVFAPKVEPWENLQTWNRYWPCFSKAGTDLPCLEMECAMDLLASET